MKLKRNREDNSEECVFRQDDKRHEKLLHSSEQGLATLRDSASSRHKLRDVKNRVVIDRVAALQDDASPVWH